MNERIQELAEQCYENDQSWTGVGQRIFNKEKFAELIVRECMEQIHIQSRGPCGDYHGQWFESDILKHFGVE
jgi:hypothetical protein